MRGLERFAPLSGVAFVGVLIASFIVVGDNAPDVDDPLPNVVAYWIDNDGEEIAGALLAAYAAVLLMWFAGVARAALRLAEGGAGRLSATAFGGLLVAAGGVFVSASLEFTLADSAGEISPQATQALSALYADFWFPMVGGLAVFLLAAGVVFVRAGAMPSWPGWIAILIGIVALTPAGFFGFLAGLVWILVFSVMLFMAGRAAEPVPPPD